MDWQSAGRKDSFVTEHHVQRDLTKLWAGQGIPYGPAERVLLLGWEVMFPSWKINDAQSHWGAPAIDFLGLDQAGHLVAVELKVGLSGRKSVLDATSQLTASALLCERSDKQVGLLTMLADLSEGANDRGIPMAAPVTMAGIFKRHQVFFDLPSRLERLTEGTRRILAVREPGPRMADHIANLRTPRTSEELALSYADYSPTPMNSRLLRLLPIRDGELVGPIACMEV